ncbi:arsenic resistance N-acetyltransferase ArsN2 [Dongia sp.]|uniref:arsenic resistance N-acetyltransferase ArsN2 n=1 Tax=Dongia sp. TaxID=1977262 RepID=UPI0035B10E47
MLSLVPLRDLTPLGAALTAEGLPVDDLAQPGRRFFEAVDAHGTRIGFGGLEGAGQDQLLRSLVIDKAARGKGLGRALVAAMNDAARDSGAERLWLLTIDAADYFRGLGFADAERAMAPAVVTESLQFTTLCPGSAKLLMKRV